MPREWGREMECGSNSHSTKSKHGKNTGNMSWEFPILCRNNLNEGDKIAKEILL